MTRSHFKASNRFQGGDEACGSSPLMARGEGLKPYSKTSGDYYRQKPQDTLRGGLKRMPKEEKPGKKQEISLVQHTGVKTGGWG